MGKKVQAEMDAQRQRFVDGCREVSGIEKAEANALFDLIDKFAGYGFNKSHAAAYALLAYQTAWLKAHYPEEFFAASMCFDMHQSEKLAVFVDDARRQDIAVEPPCINASEAEFTVEQTDDGFAVRYALAGIRNVGEKAMEAIVAEREGAGKFASLQDLFERIPKGAMNSRQLEGLACAGALDALEPNRAKLFANADMLLAVADAAQRERTSGQGGAVRRRGSDQRGPPPERHRGMVARRSHGEGAREFRLLLLRPPVAAWRDVASANGARSYASLMTGGAPAGGRSNAVMAAMVESVNKGTTRRGKPFIRADFSDASGQFSAACFEDSMVERFLKWAEEQTCILLQVELDSPSPDEPPRITVRGGTPLTEVRGSTPMLLTLDVTDPAAIGALQAELAEARGGKDEVLVTLRTGGEEEPMVRLGRDFAVDGELAERLASMAGFARVQLDKRRGGAHLRLVA